MKKTALAIAAIFSASVLFADGAGTSTGLTLLRNSGARSSALGEAFTAMDDDITAMEFNPASLSTLRSGHLSLHYERGVFDDAFSKALVGLPFGFGFSMGVYDSGKATLYDGVNSERSVTAQKDTLANLGYGFQKRSAAIGVGLKYLKSELAETNTASGWSADVGLQYQLMPRLRMGLSGPVYQSSLRYVSKEEDIAKIYRAGVNWSGSLPLATGDVPFRLLFDVPYDAAERKPFFAIGAETHVGVLALRVGMNTRSDIQRFSTGVGFHFGRMDLDYSFGLANETEFDSVHKLNFSMRFDLPKFDNRIAYQVYEIKQGESLESIAESRYGSASRWPEIFSANRHIYSSPEQIKPGSRIVIPAPPQN